VKTEEKQEEESSEVSEENKTSSAKDDDYILAKLLGREGVSAICHDSIVENYGQNGKLVEAEAASIAKRAVDALRKSRQSCDQVIMFK